MRQKAAVFTYVPVTAQRPETARHPTRTSRSNMNIVNPDQIPARPQPNTSDSQVSGRHPISALITVAVRMNAASPAPNSTPSNAKTIPATGKRATRNHHGTPIAASTNRSLVNSLGTAKAPTANTAASAPAAIAESTVTRRAIDYRYDISGYSPRVNGDL